MTPALQVRQDLVDHKRILNTVVRHSDNDPGRAVFIGPTEPAAHKHCSSGKSNSIAWTAHQLSSLYDDKGEKQFHSVIIVTD